MADRTEEKRLLKESLPGAEPEYASVHTMEPHRELLNEEPQPGQIILIAPEKEHTEKGKLTFRPSLKKKKEEKKASGRSFWKTGGIFAFCLVFLICFGSQLIEASRPRETNTNQFKMPNLTSMEEKAARKMLEEAGAQVEILYTDSDLYDPGTVVMCSADPGSILDKGTVVQVYIQQRTGQPAAGTFTLPEIPQYRRGVILSGCTFDSVERSILCTFTNTSSRRIVYLRFAAGFEDAAGISLPDREYVLDPVSLMPSQSITQKILVENAQAVSMSLKKVETRSEALENGM